MSPPDDDDDGRCCCCDAGGPVVPFCDALSLSLLPQPLKRGASTSCLKHRLDGDDRWKPVYFRIALGFAYFSCGGCVNPAGSQDAGFSPSLREGFASLSSLFPCSDNLPNAPE